MTASSRSRCWKASDWNTRRSFRRPQESLKPGGDAVLRVIPSPKKFQSYLRSPDFIQLNVFTGGILPTVTIMREQITRAGLVLMGEKPSGRVTRKRLPIGGGDFMRFGRACGRRVWTRLSAGNGSYLAYCQAGF